MVYRKKNDLISNLSKELHRVILSEMRKIGREEGMRIIIYINSNAFEFI